MAEPTNQHLPQERRCRGIGGDREPHRVAPHDAKRPLAPPTTEDSPHLSLVAGAAALGEKPHESRCDGHDLQAYRVPIAVDPIHAAIDRLPSRFARHARPCELVLADLTISL